MSIDLSAEKNFIKGLQVNGDLIVTGKLFMCRKIEECPEELINTTNENIVFNDTVTFTGDLFIHPSGQFVVTGQIKSNGFMNTFK